MEEILREHTIKVGRDEKHEFLIKWADYARLMWEPASALDNITALDHYEDHLKEAQHFNKERDNIRD